MGLQRATKACFALRELLESWRGLRTGFTAAGRRGRPRSDARDDDDDRAISSWDARSRSRAAARTFPAALTRVLYETLRLERGHTVPVGPIGAQVRDMG